MNPDERVFPVAGDGLVKLLVILLFELGLGALPHGAGGVDLLGGTGLDRLLFLSIPLALVVSEEDRKSESALTEITSGSVIDPPRRRLL